MTFATVLERLTKLNNPFPGLRSFEVDEAHLFFGRDQQVLDLLERLARSRFVAVLGLSGSGKSSLVKAGLIPALQRGRLLEPGLRWRHAIVRPGAAPFGNLAAALECSASDLRASSQGLISQMRRRLPDGEGLLLVIDQFEELFRYKDRSSASSGRTAEQTAKASEALAFVELLRAAVRDTLPIYVVITMRTDYLGDCAEFPEFPEILNESQYLVPRLTREQRRLAIEGPLGLTKVDSALVEQILNDAGDEPDQLPVLQHTLMRTWSHWKNRSPEGNIELADYEAIGRCSGALNQHANELLDKAGVRGSLEIVEVIFKRLTAVARGNRERRDPAQLSELWLLCRAQSEQRARVNKIIDVFGTDEATFLTRSGGQMDADSYVDITHEALIRQWKLLADKWQPEEEQSAKTLVELVDRAKGWQEGKRELLGKLDLAAALEWDEKRNRSPKWAEHYVPEADAIELVEAFLSASREAFERSEKDEIERQTRELKAQAELASARRIRILAYLLAGLLTLICALTVTSWKSMIDAKQASLAALRQEGIAEQNAKEAMLQKHYADSVRAEAVILAHKASEAEARAIREQTLAESRELAAKAQSSAAIGDEGVALLEAMRAFTLAPTAEAKEAVSHAILLALPDKRSSRTYVRVLSPDRQIFVTAGDGNTARVWKTLDGQLIATLSGHGGAIYSTEFSPDGRLVATASSDNTARIWDPFSGRVLAKLAGHTGPVFTANFSPDGRRIVTASEDGTARVWDIYGLQEVAVLRGHTAAVNAAMFSPDTKFVITASSDQTARLWDARTGSLIVTMIGHKGTVYTATFSPDMRRIVTASADSTAREWDPHTGRETMRLNHPTPVYNAVFSLDAKQLVTTSQSAAWLWDAVTGQLVLQAKRRSHEPGFPSQP